MPAVETGCRAAKRTLSATSRRNAVLSAAASSKVSGGTRRVLARPGADAFAMKAMPQLAAFARGGGGEARHESDVPLKDLPLNRFARLTRCPPLENHQQRTHADMTKTPEMGQSLPAHFLQVRKQRKVILFTKS